LLLAGFLIRQIARRHDETCVRPFYISSSTLPHSIALTEQLCDFFTALILTHTLPYFDR